MPELIRPQARAALLRWREVLIALALFALGLWWALTRFGLLSWIGWALALGALALGWSAYQRLRFGAQGEAPGVVQVVEAEIRYFAPLVGGTGAAMSTGGVVAIDAISRLGLSRDRQLWLIGASDGGAFEIPRAAQGADALFDAYAALPGIDMQHLLRALEQPANPEAEILWQRQTPSSLPTPP